MDVNADALAAALKMAGENTVDMEHTLRLIHTMQAIQRDGANPQTMMNLMAQYNPRFAAMSALVRALAQGGAAESEPKGDAPPDDGVQYNHF